MASEHYDGRAKLAHSLLATELSVEQIESALAAAAGVTAAAGGVAPGGRAVAAPATATATTLAPPKAGNGGDAHHNAAVAAAKGFAARKYGVGGRQGAYEKAPALQESTNFQAGEVDQADNPARRAAAVNEARGFAARKYGRSN